jgi:hypothetical protein
VAGGNDCEKHAAGFFKQITGYFAPLPVGTDGALD